MFWAEDRKGVGTNSTNYSTSRTSTEANKMKLMNNFMSVLGAGIAQWLEHRTRD